MLCFSRVRVSPVFFDLPGATESAFRQPPSGSLLLPPIAGLGLLGALTLRPTRSPRRLGLARRFSREIEVIASGVVDGTADEIAPRFFGGVAFDGRSAARTAPWALSGAGSFILPRWTYAHGEGDSRLELRPGAR